MGALGAKKGTGEGPNTALVVGGGVGGGALLGCLLPLLALILVFGGILMLLFNTVLLPVKLMCQAGACPDLSVLTDKKSDADQISEVFAGDGRGDLNDKSVPPEYLDAIEKAGKECPRIGPIVIAAQIAQESGFKEDLVGSDGAEGISQLPPGKFKEFGEDDDDNGESSALDPEDSIMAQGRYMCSLAEDIDKLIANNQVAKADDSKRLDMTLAAYHLGLKAVEKAKGTPGTEEAKIYVTAVRSSFSLYAGVVKAPEGESYPTPSPLPPSPSSESNGEQ